MKVHQFARGFWEHEATGCKRLRPLAPKLAASASAFDLKSFIRPGSGPRRHGSSDYPNKESTQVDAPVGGTRWNPTQEQIGILEMLYQNGMRTPNTQQIEQITLQLSNYGKIEGKNVFYWFQNHKARERQKQKQKRLIHTGEESDYSSQKRKSRSWGFKQDEEERTRTTLKLFPLHPEGRLRDD